MPRKKEDKSPASRSQGTRDRPCGHFVTFTEEQNKHLHMIVKRDGQEGGVAGFLRAAAIQRMDEADRRYRARAAWEAEQDQQGPRPRGMKFDEPQPAPARGFKFKLEEPQQDPDPEPSPPPPPPPPPPVTQVVVNQGPPAANSEIARLAKYITTAATNSDRDRRTVTANEILKTSAKDREEALDLARKLDEEINKIRTDSTTTKSKSPLDMIDRVGDWLFKP